VKRLLALTIVVWSLTASASESPSGGISSCAAAINLVGTIKKSFAYQFLKPADKPSADIAMAAYVSGERVILDRDKSSSDRLANIGYIRDIRAHDQFLEFDFEYIVNEGDIVPLKTRTVEELNFPFLPNFIPLTPEREAELLNERFEQLNENSKEPFLEAIEYMKSGTLIRVSRLSRSFVGRVVEISAGNHGSILMKIETDDGIVTAIDWPNFPHLEPVEP
jgi:hypothetical protein